MKLALVAMLWVFPLWQIALPGTRRAIHTIGLTRQQALARFLVAILLPGVLMAALCRYIAPSLPPSVAALIGWGVALLLGMLRLRKVFPLPATFWQFFIGVPLAVLTTLAIWPAPHPADWLLHGVLLVVGLVIGIPATSSLFHSLNSPENPFRHRPAIRHAVVCLVVALSLWGILTWV